MEQGEKIVACLLAVSIFAGCDGSSYTASTEAADAAAEFAEANGVEVDAVMATYTFTEDGKVTQQTADASMEGTCTFDGTNVELEIDAGTMSFEYVADKDALYTTDLNNGYTSQFDRIPEDEE